MSFNAVYNKLGLAYGKVEEWHRLRGKETYNAIKNIVKDDIPGDWAECGVADGKSSMVGILSFLDFGSPERTIWMYDTYEGVPGQSGGFDEPSDIDVDHSGRSAKDLWKSGVFSKPKYNVTDTWVKNKLLCSGYPAERLKFVKGKVEDTIPKQIPDKISLLRLDVDMYCPTKHCLEFLYPRLETGGFLLIDDYGHWRGCKRATDEYFDGPLGDSWMGDYTLLVYRKK